MQTRLNGIIFLELNLVFHSFDFIKIEFVDVSGIAAIYFGAFRFLIVRVPRPKHYKLNAASALFATANKGISKLVQFTVRQAHFENIVYVAVRTGFRLS